MDTDRALYIRCLAMLVCSVLNIISAFRMGPIWISRRHNLLLRANLSPFAPPIHPLAQNDSATTLTHPHNRMAHLFVVGARARGTVMWQWAPPKSAARDHNGFSLTHNSPGERFARKSECVFMPTLMIWSKLMMMIMPIITVIACAPGRLAVRVRPINEPYRCAIFK